MFRQLLNEMEITVEIEGRSAVLIKDGRYGREQKKAWAQTKDDQNRMPAMAFISRSPLGKLEAALRGCATENYAGIAQLDYYLPGSSVRGAWRSYLEKVLRSLPGPPRVCDPLSAETEDGGGAELPDYTSCSSVLVKKDRDRPEQPYAWSCPVCRLFGNTALGSRIAFSDGRKKAGEAALIDGIAVSRFTGSVAHGKNYKILALRHAKFELTVRLRNFELWHLGLLANLFKDLGDGRVALGSGKSRGLGEVTARAGKIAVTEYGSASLDGELRGVAEHVNLGAEMRRRYGLTERAPVAVRLEPAGSTLWRRTRATSDTEAFWDSVRPCFDRTTWERFPSLEGRDALAARA